MRELGRTEEAAAAYRGVVEGEVTRGYELHALLESAGIEDDGKQFQRVACLLRRLRQSAASGDVRHSLADISQAQAMLGYEVKVDFEQGLRRIIAWYREHDG